MVRDLGALARLLRHFRRGTFDIVHTHTPKPGLLGQLAARMAGVPVIVNTIHGFYFHEHTSHLMRRFYITMEKIAAHCSDGSPMIWAASEWSLQPGREGWRWWRPREELGVSGTWGETPLPAAAGIAPTTGVEFRTSISGNSGN